jgi:methylthioribose-1-phosphate isomerase
MTHCNAGALATAGYGTALGVIRAAREAGKNVSVIAGETRPFLQGARLTAWELKKEHIPVTLMTDGMAGHVMSTESIACVIVGADRIAANGDVANKIGTYNLAVLAKRHHIPFYVAAPMSTIDPKCRNGGEIPIESRDTAEVTQIGERQVAPTGVRVLNPAFDVTPHSLVTAIITERGVIRAPYTANIRKLVDTRREAREKRASQHRQS